MLSQVTVEMDTVHHSPGEAAEQAFTLGLVAAMVLGVAGVVFLLWVRILTVMTAVLASVIGLPILLIIASCLLSVWLGYNRNALDSAIQSQR
jgi:hypothetical protein